MDINKFAIKLGLFIAALQLVGCASVRRIEAEVTAFSSFAAPAVASATAVQPTTPIAATPSATTSATQTLTAAIHALSGATYRFDRLPSQQANPVQQDKLEALAQAALDKAQLQRVGDAPGSPKARLAVQMGISMQQGNTPWTPWMPWPYDFAFGADGALDAGLGYGPSAGYVSISVGLPVYTHGVYGPSLFYDPFYRPYGFNPYLYAPPPWVQTEVSLVLREVASNQVVFETRAKHSGPWYRSSALLSALFEAALQGFPTPPAGSRRVVIDIPN